MKICGGRWMKKWPATRSAGSGWQAIPVIRRTNGRTPLPEVRFLALSANQARGILRPEQGEPRRVSVSRSGGPAKAANAASLSERPGAHGDDATVLARCAG